jgi:6,7-dimethyl-8-ribityllumazine synthase
MTETSDWPFRESTASRLRPRDEPFDVESERQYEAAPDGEPRPERALEVEAAAVEQEAPPAFVVEAEPEATIAPEPAPEPEAEPEPEVEPEAVVEEHAGGEFRVPDGYSVLEGQPAGERRAVAVVVSRFNGEITQRQLELALEELEAAGVSRDAVLVMPVPGAFELPLAAMALAKSRRYACIVALGCVIRGETAHFDYVAGEAASGLQLASLETGVPVSFGLLTTETREQAEARIDRARDAVRTALEMADLFSRLRAAAVAR